MERRTFLRAGLALGAAGLGGGVGLLPQSAGATLKPASGGPIRLSSNENPLGLAPGARRAVIEAIEEANRYPGARRAQLIEALAQRHGVAVDNIVPGNGSTEVLQMAVQAFYEPGARLILAEPTYEDVPWYAQPYPYELVKVPLTQRHAHDLGRMREAAAAAPTRALIYLCNPNNPTGTLTSSAEIDAWIETASDDVFFLVDEAYFDYCEDPGYWSCLKWIDSRPNLLVVRTFSKIYGMAGMRLGYGIAHPDTAGRLRQYIGRNNANQLALAAALASLEDAELVSRSLEANRQGVRVLHECLHELGLEYLPSHTNFVMHRITGDLETYQKRMLESGIRVGRAFPPMLEYNRLSIGLPQEMERFADTLRGFRAGDGAIRGHVARVPAQGLDMTVTERRYCSLPALALPLAWVAAGALALPTALPAQDVEARIRGIEEHVLPLIVIKGEPVETATLAERMGEFNVPGVSIAVINEGRIEWARGWGMADVEEGRPVTPSTLFQAASISKPVAAMAALKLVQEGRLDLDEPVNVRLATWKIPENDLTTKTPVTLRHLLTHTGGTTVHGFPGYARGAAIPSTVDVLDGAGNTDPIRVDIIPGPNWRYSGGGYTVVQQLLSDVTGQPFPDLMRRLVLDPAGMTSSTYAQPLPDSLHELAATGYRGDGAPVEGKWHVYPEMAAAGLWTTPSDLARFAIDLQRAHAGESGSVLSREMATKMLTRGLNNWGLGPALTSDGARFGHGGANEGFRCALTAFIEGGRGAVIMTNSDRGDSLNRRILLTIAREYGWPGFEPTVKEVAELEPAAYERVAGRYSFPGLGIVTLEIEDGRLWAEAPGLGREELLPESETRWFLRGDGSPVRFDLEDSRVVALLYGGTRAEKID